MPKDIQEIRTAKIQMDKKDDDEESHLEMRELAPKPTSKNQEEGRKNFFFLFHFFTDLLSPLINNLWIIDSFPSIFDVSIGVLQLIIGSYCSIDLCPIQ